MGETTRLTAADGHAFAVYRASPEGPARGALVVIQEIFGVNEHIREVCDGFAADGYVALAPALFDRIEPGIELAYDPTGIARGRALRQELGWDAPLRDIAATIGAAGATAKVGVIGYCWGGSLAWLAATRLAGLACAVGYYGGQIIQFKDERPRVPVMLHFGEHES